MPAKTARPEGEDRLFKESRGLRTHTPADVFAHGGPFYRCWCHTCQPGIFPERAPELEPPAPQPERQTVLEDEDDRFYEQWLEADLVADELQRKAQKP